MGKHDGFSDSLKYAINDTIINAFHIRADFRSVIQYVAGRYETQRRTENLEMSI